MGLCLLCDPPKRIPDEKLLAHLRDVHGEDITHQTWPDGAAVVIDRTLDPEDFGEQAA